MAVLRGNFSALCAYIKTLKIYHSGNVTANMKALKQKEETTPKRRKQHKLNKLGTETNKIVTKNKTKNQQNRIDS